MERDPRASVVRRRVESIRRRTCHSKLCARNVDFQLRSRSISAADRGKGEEKGDDRRSKEFNVAIATLKRGTSEHWIARPERDAPGDPKAAAPSRTLEDVRNRPFFPRRPATARGDPASGQGVGDLAEGLRSASLGLSDSRQHFVGVRAGDSLCGHVRPPQALFLPKPALRKASSTRAL